MASPLAVKRSSGPSHISCLPDELLSQVLRLLPFAAKAAAHSVSKRWNRVLRHPLIPNLWQDCELELTAASLTTQRERELWRIADWLARRAPGIQLLLIHSGPWRDANVIPFTESGFFYKQQLPYLLGQLRHKGVQLKLSFWSAGEWLVRLCPCKSALHIASNKPTSGMQILTCCSIPCYQTHCSSPT